MLPIIARLLHAVHTVPLTIALPEENSPPVIDEDGRLVLERKVNELEARAYLWKHQPMRRGEWHF